MKIHGLQGTSLKTFNDLHGKIKEYFIRIDTSYLESSQLIRVVFIKQGLDRCVEPCFDETTLQNSLSTTIGVHTLSMELRS